MVKITEIGSISARNREGLQLLMLICIFFLVVSRSTLIKPNPHRPSSKHEGIAGESKRTRMISNLMRIDEDMHFYPRQLFFRNYNKQKKYKEFRIISRFFPTESATMSASRYSNFLNAYLQNNKLEGIIENSSQMKRIRILVEKYLSGDNQRSRSLEDVYDDLYKGNFFEWIFESPMMDDL